MGEKIYMRDNSIQYLGYYLIEYELYEYVFHKFSTAIGFCWSRGLDPNKVIQTNSYEVFRKCKDISHRRLEEITHTKENISKIWEEALAESKRLGEQIRKYEEILNEKRDLGAQVDLDMTREKAITQAGVVHGIYECIKAIDVERENYWRIVYCVNKWSKG